MIDLSSRAVSAFGVVLVSGLGVTPAAAGVGAIAAAFAAEVRLTAGDTPFGLAIGDLNNDGNDDLVVANLLADASVYLGNGDGTFTAQPDALSGPGTAAAISDLDGDGNADLAVTNGDTDDVSVLLGNGDGTFQDRDLYEVRANPRDVAVADLDGDTIVDLVTASNGSGISMGGAGLSVLLGNGDGSFGTRQVFPAGIASRDVALADLDGDGELDAAVANVGNPPVGINATMTVHIGNGDGTFQTRVIYTPGDSPQGVVIADLDGDTSPDVVVANGGAFPEPGDLSVFINNGDGTLMPEYRVGAGDNPRKLSAGDLNGDALIDLAVANTTSGDVTVLLGNGDGSFGSPLSLSVGDGPQHAVLGDLNNDAMPDIATPNAGTDDASVILNESPVCAADFNADGVASFPDIGLFLGAFAASDPAADLTGDGSVSFPDVGAFLAAFAAGCP